MQNRVFCHHAPPATMGCGAAEKLPGIISACGTKVFVVTDPGVADQPFFDGILRLLREAKCQVDVFRDVLPDPPIAVFEACRHLAASFQADCVLGIGGGSALDVAKIVAVLARHDLDIATLFGIDQVPARGLPTILVPTTAGTGSEVTPIAVASDEEQHLKRGIVSEHILAHHAVIDPELCKSLPPWPTAYTGMDALTRAIEAFTNVHAVPLIDALALEAVRLISEYLPRAVHNGADIDARYAMSRASMLGGMCLGPVNTAAVHAMAYPLGGRFNVPHGVANSLLLPHVMNFNMSVVEDRYRVIAHNMGCQDGDAVSAVRQLSAEVGTNKQMREFGVTEADLPEMAAAAVEVTRLMVNNPRPVTEGDALAIYQAAW